MLLAQNLVRQFSTAPGQPAGGVFGVDFDVKAGEFFTLLGPSGCGKTTTLRLIAGLDSPDDGRIMLNRVAVFDRASGVNVPMYRRDIGLVFQSYAIWPHMDVFKNAAYPLLVARPKLPRAAIAARVDRMLDRVGLAAYKHRPATQLSGGQQQRLALARALVREPKLLLLDEPLSNLDSVLREQMRTELKTIQRETGVTTVYVTHDQAEAMSLSDRIAVLNQGRIVQCGPPREIYDVPNSRFVAGFIGRANLFAASAGERAEAKHKAMVSSELGPIRCFFATAAAPGDGVTIVIRPENVFLRKRNTPATEAAENLIEGEIVTRVYLGDIAEYTVMLLGSRPLIVRVNPASDFALGERVTVGFPAESAIAICE